MGQAVRKCTAKTNWDELPRSAMPTQDISKIKMLVCTLDYAVEYAGSSGCGPLTASTDGSRFLSLAMQAGVPEENIIHMMDSEENAGTSLWPNKANMTANLKKMAADITKMGDDAMFVFFFAGHGATAEEGPFCGDEADGIDEFLCLMEDKGYSPDTQYEEFLDDDMKDIVYANFPRTNKMLFVTDCCHSGTVCDLDDPILGGHQIVHFAAVQDYQEAKDVGGGAFTVSMLETIEDLCEQGVGEMSVEELYTQINTKYGPRWAADGLQDFNYNATMQADASTFPFPFFPAGFSVKTLID